jgi:WhiB family redox-sensing transcriptional regulator
VNGPTPGAVVGTTSYRAGSPLEWRERGACRTADPELFYGPDGERGNSNARNERQAAAKAVCGGCPVLVECRRYALDTREEHGVWGGLDEDEREAALAAEAPRPASNGSEAWRVGVAAAQAARQAKVIKAREELLADVEHLIGMGADVYAAARATGRSVKALRKALERAGRHDLNARLSRVA